LQKVMESDLSQSLDFPTIAEFSDLDDMAIGETQPVGLATHPWEVENVSPPAAIALPRNPRLRSRGWMFTWNNPTETGPQLLHRLSSIRNPPRYIVFQEEIGHETATRHFQGYVYFSNARVSPRESLFVLNGDSEHGAYVRAASGTPQQNRTYCTKEDTRVGGPWEYGSLPSIEKNIDIVDATEMLQSGATMQELQTAMPSTFVLNSAGLYRFHRNLGQGSHPTYLPRQNFLFIGPPRSGKSWHARLCEPDAYIKLPDQWWDSYCGQQAVIWDDFAAGWSIPLVRLLQLTDNYYTRVEIKGGYEHFVATVNIFTTNIHPRSWFDYTHRQEHRAALGARFHGIYFFDHLRITNVIEDLDAIRHWWMTDAAPQFIEAFTATANQQRTPFPIRYPNSGRPQE